MSKRKQSPHRPKGQGLATSQDPRASEARLAANFTQQMAPTSGPVSLTIERARDFVVQRKDDAGVAMRAMREARARRGEAMAEGRVRRRFLAEQRALDRGIVRFWRRFFGRVRRERKRDEATARQSVARSAGAKPLAAYRGPVIDRLGRQSVYMKVDYHGARRTRVGVARRLVLYVTRERGVERDGDGAAMTLSNVGNDRLEQAAAFDLVETLNRAARGNAKIVFSMIVNLPHDVSAQARREILGRFCDECFGLHDLPFVAALHTPSADGDQRNHHGHIVFSLRPLRHVGAYEWEAGRELLSEFDNQARFGYNRALFAQVMTDVVREQGRNRTYTHLSNASRGLKAKPLIELGQAKTAAIRRGEIVADNERNRATIARNELLVAADRAQRAIQRGERNLAELRQLRAQRMPAQTSWPRGAIGAAPVRFSPAVELQPIPQPIAHRLVPSVSGVAPGVQVARLLTTPQGVSIRIVPAAVATVVAPASGMTRLEVCPSVESAIRLAALPLLPPLSAPLALLRKPILATSQGSRLKSATALPRIAEQKPVAPRGASPIEKPPSNSAAIRAQSPPIIAIDAGRPVRTPWLLSPAQAPLKIPDPVPLRYPDFGVTAPRQPAPTPTAEPEPRRDSDEASVRHRFQLLEDRVARAKARRLNRRRSARRRMPGDDGIAD